MTGKYNIELFKLKAELCKTFADPTRLLILEELRGGEKKVGELSDNLDTPQAVISRHLAILREKGIVTARRSGTTAYYSLTDMKICDACDLVHGILMNQIEHNRELAKRLAS